MKNAESYTSTPSGPSNHQSIPPPSPSPASHPPNVSSLEQKGREEKEIVLWNLWFQGWWFGKLKSSGFKGLPTPNLRFKVKEELRPVFSLPFLLMVYTRLKPGAKVTHIASQDARRTAVVPQPVIYRYPNLCPPLFASPKSRFQFNSRDRGFCLPW